jgi:hypothetical protein
MTLEEIIAGLDQPTYTLDEVADLLKIKPGPLKRSCGHGDYEHIHQGQDRLMTPDQILLYLERKTVKPKSPALDEMAVVRAKAQERVNRKQQRRRREAAA